MLKQLFVAAVLLAPLTASAAVYQCTVNGQSVFSDTPCGDDAKEIAPKAAIIGGQFDTNSDVKTYQPPAREHSSGSNACPYINSTKINRLIIKKTIITGMKPADVRRSWGSPSSIRRGSGSTQWAYHWDSGNDDYVYFRHGCVSSSSSYTYNY